jgi:RNA polymerase sigma-70 factor (ECF subfamily)
MEGVAMDDRTLAELLQQARAGDAGSVQRLFTEHRERLKQMIRLRLDRRIAARVDPSDVVQETLAEAVRRLPKYLEEQPIPFYPWLRQIAWERLTKLHERHIATQRRAVGREERAAPPLSDESVMALAERFVASGTSVSERLVREELKRRVHKALAELSDMDREVLVLRYLEQLSPREARIVLGIGEEAFAKRHLRAIQRLRRVLQGEK